MVNIRTRRNGRKYPIRKTAFKKSTVMRGRGGVAAYVIRPEEGGFYDIYFGPKRKALEKKHRAEHKERHQKEREYRKKNPYHFEFVHEDDELGNLI